MSDNGAPHKVKRRCLARDIPPLSLIARRMGTFQHHQPPAAPKVTRAQGQLSESSSSLSDILGSPTAAADNPATAVVEGGDGLLINMDVEAFLKA
ncbi:hypothetical protein HPB50_018809 [Hyalomma asiaticum]|uniref:Uncharacterized protein n=1 Tax=Hyalomma asiaticum TaxID=266040 RepID=A0ACB7TN13_HYAAI|nr:hypothetical protein HPB50_018809 [Hyalomma asiaticum]